MKNTSIVLTFVFGLIFFIANPLYADEMQELKDQVNALQSTIETLKAKIEKLEQKQTLQSEEVAKIPKITKSVEDLKKQPLSGWLGEGARVGGHLKMFMLDESRGKRNKQETRSNNVAAGISTAYIYIDKDLSDTTSISIQPEIDVTASATPSLGSEITRATSGSVSTSIHAAYIKTLLPNGVELKVGAFLPYFCEEYASEVWWDEQYHANAKLNNIQSWSDNGIELYKNFDFPKWSLPAYFYLLNGENKFTDNNEGKSVLVHIAPTAHNLKFLGSFGYGRWDANNRFNSWRSASGLEWKHKKFTLRSEYLYNKYENTSLTSGSTTYGLVDTEKKGYYIKGLYRFNPKWRAVFDYSDVELPYTTGTVLLKDTYRAITLGLNYFVTDSSVIIGEVSAVDADRSDGSETLKYYRTTVGWRTTF